MSALSFNSSNWFEPQDVFIMATDDDIILESPYGAIVSVLSTSDRPSYNNNNTITLVIDDSDSGKKCTNNVITMIRQYMYIQPYATYTLVKNFVFPQMFETNIASNIKTVLKQQLFIHLNFPRGLKM